MSELDKRISRHQLFMEIAHVVAKRATCMRLNVGAVIVDSRHSVISIGYNGSPPGEDHCLGAECPGAKSGCTLTIHAEDNAIRRIPEGVDGPLDLYVTDSPCAGCFEQIRLDGRIKRIFFSTPYRFSDHLTLKPGSDQVRSFRILPAGYVINWETKELVG